MARILIIDDEEQVRATLSELVATLGHRVSVAGDGSGGLDLLSRERFDCVITDLAMPEVDGLTVLRRVKRSRPETGVLVITGNSTVDLLATCLNMGVDGYVTKPFKIAEFEEQLSRILARQDTKSSGPPARGDSSSPRRRLVGPRVPIVWAILAATVLLAAGHLLLR